MRSIIDADPIIYRVGFGNDNMPLSYQCKGIDAFIEKILRATEADDHVLYLTGSGNFRDEVATIQPYKGNRDKAHRPRFHKELREYMIEEWDAILVEGMEADDACGIDAYDCRADDVEYVICSVDKDLLMLEGRHYNYNRETFTDVNEIEAWRTFAIQMLTGDASDNIPGLYRTTGKKATKDLKETILHLDSPEDILDFVSTCYVENQDEPVPLEEIARLLWMKRTPDDSDEASTLALCSWNT